MCIRDSARPHGDVPPQVPVGEALERKQIVPRIACWMVTGAYTTTRAAGRSGGYALQPDWRIPPREYRERSAEPLLKRTDRTIQGPVRGPVRATPISQPHLQSGTNVSGIHYRSRSARISVSFTLSRCKKERYASVKPPRRETGRTRFHPTCGARAMELFVVPKSMPIASVFMGRKRTQEGGGDAAGFLRG